MAPALGARRATFVHYFSNHTIRSDQSYPLQHGEGDAVLNTSIANTRVWGLALWLVLNVIAPAQAQDAKGMYPKMAPLEQYLIPDRNAEIALARSAAPESISQNAEVMVLGKAGYETAVKGSNGFVCIVERSWAATPDDPDFWNPKLRAPICFNAPAARFNIPMMQKRTQSILASQSKTQMVADLSAALDKKEIPPLEAGAMCYMMSKQGYLSDRDGHWRPHLMFFVPPTDAAAWGAGLPGSPIIAFTDTPERLTVFLVPVGHWSCLLYTSPSPRDGLLSRMPSSA